ncbi:hypothetical protein HYDPIDRAFT_34369 [Hydnomerulius pinastri MD-312]|uniref:Myosin motor domain-containing protein n=1 Tax=Hydnomerulius pinastri MD-312 TaxID=994086 RepID=A0A0C9VY12_9AGAM|nr:hypothetical protein HYDPIDRAFT_34369 [Hydnomerulius pinastri MD-312]
MSTKIAWLSEHINQRLRREDFKIQTFVGLVDLPGPQNMTNRPNSLDQFCINFANERLQNFVQKRLFETHVDEYYRSSFPTFTINHFNSPITYSAEGFLSRNLGALHPNFVSLLRGLSAHVSDGSEGAGSINPFVKGLFSAKAIATQAHPKDEDAIVSAQQPVKPMRAPSTCHKGTIKCMPTLRENAGVEQEGCDDDDSPSSGGTPCVAGEFCAALDIRSIGDPYAPYSSGNV